MGDAFIIDAVRTPRGIGKVGKGALAEIHPQQPHPAADVIPDAARRDNPLLIIHCRDPADREPVSPVNIRHRQRLADDARKGCYVCYLLGGFVREYLRKELFVGINYAARTHCPFPGNTPAVIIYLL